jgi:predicted RNase H-like HicB family nuclease
MHYPATLLPHPTYPGRYDVTFADLPGCVSSGDSLEHALQMAQEALTLHLYGMLEDGDTLPEPSSLEEARGKEETEAKAFGDPLPVGTIYQFIVAEPRQQVKESAPVRLSISLKPAIVERIDSMAEEMGITRSGLIAVATQDYLNRMSD